LDIIQKCTLISKISKKVFKVTQDLSSAYWIQKFTMFWVKKTCFWVKKCGKYLEKVGKVRKKYGKVRKRVFRTFGNCSIPTFQKLWKNDVKLELRKSQKTRSDSKADSKVWLKVRNAGPYLMVLYISNKIQPLPFFLFSLSNYFCLSFFLSYNLFPFFCLTLTLFFSYSHT